jgi:hypothetical protein
VSLYALVAQAVRCAWCAQLAGPGSSVSGSRLLKETFHNLQNADFLLLSAKHSCTIFQRESKGSIGQVVFVLKILRNDYLGRSAGIRRKLYADFV